MSEYQDWLKQQMSDVNQLFDAMVYELGNSTERI